MDDNGYPRTLPADRILLGARIVAAADVFDALTAPRYYKPAYTLEKTLEIMDGMAGDHLDPAVGAAVRRNVHDLEWTLDSMKHTWPKPGDDAMTAAPESGLSERDQAPSSRATDEDPLLGHAVLRPAAGAAHRARRRHRRLG